MTRSLPVAAGLWLPAAQLAPSGAHGEHSGRGDGAWRRQRACVTRACRVTDSRRACAAPVAGDAAIGAVPLPRRVHLGAHGEGQPGGGGGRRRRLGGAGRRRAASRDAKRPRCAPGTRRQRPAAPRARGCVPLAPDRGPVRGGGPAAGRGEHGRRAGGRHGLLHAHAALQPHRRRHTPTGHGGGAWARRSGVSRAWAAGNRRILAHR